MEAWEIKLTKIIDQLSSIAVRTEYYKSQKNYSLGQADYWLKLYYNNSCKYFKCYNLPAPMHKVAAKAMENKNNI